MKIINNKVNPTVNTKSKKQGGRGVIDLLIVC